jgi:predicted RNA-binding Zn-ribbon protein involved in translation (DUF1610 family)
VDAMLQPDAKIIAMSMERSVSLDCPQCGQSQETVVWTSLNVQVSPEAKADFFNGKTNVFECQACGETANIATAFMYHDMELKFCVQYYPEDSID